MKRPAGLLADNIDRLSTLIIHLGGHILDRAGSPVGNGENNGLGLRHLLNEWLLGYYSIHVSSFKSIFQSINAERSTFCVVSTQNKTYKHYILRENMQTHSKFIDPNTKQEEPLDYVRYFKENIDLRKRTIPEL